MPQRTAGDCDFMQSLKTCFWIIYNDMENCSWFKQNRQVTKLRLQLNLAQIFLKYRNMPKSQRIWLLNMAEFGAILILILCALVFSEYSRIKIIFSIGKKRYFKVTLNVWVEDMMAWHWLGSNKASTNSWRLIPWRVSGLGCQASLRTGKNSGLGPSLASAGTPPGLVPSWQVGLSLSGPAGTVLSTHRAVGPLTPHAALLHAPGYLASCPPSTNLPVDIPFKNSVQEWEFLFNGCKFAHLED